MILWSPNLCEKQTKMTLRQRQDAVDLNAYIPSEDGERSILYKQCIYWESRFKQGGEALLSHSRSNNSPHF